MTLECRPNPTNHRHVPGRSGTACPKKESIFGSPQEVKEWNLPMTHGPRFKKEVPQNPFRATCLDNMWYMCMCFNVATGATSEPYDYISQSNEGINSTLILRKKQGPPVPWCIPFQILILPADIIIRFSTWTYRVLSHNYHNAKGEDAKTPLKT